jgi:hypothetical protein
MTILLVVALAYIAFAVFFYCMMSIFVQLTTTVRRNVNNSRSRPSVDKQLQIYQHVLTLSYAWPYAVYKLLTYIKNDKPAKL